MGRQGSPFSEALGFKVGVLIIAVGLISREGVREGVSILVGMGVLAWLVVTAIDVLVEVFGKPKE